jgi:hypothetical protein
VCLIARFSEYISIDNNRRISSEHWKLLPGAPYRERLFPRESRDIGARTLSGKNRLVDIRARNYVRDANL